MDREAWRAAIHGVTKNRTWLSDWTELNWSDTSIGKILLSLPLDFATLLLRTINFPEHSVEKPILQWASRPPLLCSVQPLQDIQSHSNWGTILYTELVSLWDSAVYSELVFIRCPQYIQSQHLFEVFSLLDLFVCLLSCVLLFVTLWSV